MPEPLKVVIAEDNYLVREGTRRLLEDSGEVDVVAAVGDADELRDAVRRLRPTPSSPTSGCRRATTWKASRRRTRSAPSTRASGWWCCPSTPTRRYAFALLRDGTDGLAYLLKDRLGDLDELLRALRAVVNGGSVIDPVVVQSLVARRTRLAQSPVASLTPRELDVLREMAQGKTNAGIERRCTYRPPASRNTSTRSSPSWALPSSPCTAGWRPCSRSSTTVRSVSHRLTRGSRPPSPQEPAD